MNSDSIIANIFTLPFFMTKVPKDVIKQILNIVDNQHFEMDVQGFSTDFYNDNGYSPEVYEILKPYISSIVCKYLFKNLPDKIPSMWAQKYYKNSEHSIHNHGNRGISFILYLKFNPDVHKGTIYYAPFDDIFTGESINFVPHVEEGNLVAFPSVLKHSSQYQTSDQERMILSFNMFEDGPPKDMTTTR